MTALMTDSVTRAPRPRADLACAGHRDPDLWHPLMPASSSATTQSA